MSGNLITIKALGTSFRIQVDENPDYMKEVLEHLNSAISKIENSTGMKDPLKIALLTSIYLIDELNKERKSDKKESLENEFSELTERIISCIESVLEDN